MPIARCLYRFILTLIIWCVALGARAATHYVSVAGTNPIAPYSDWATSATNIQEAIDASSAGDLILVTNGIYSSGGKAMSGDLTNRVALDKGLTVQSVNGPQVTAITGEGIGPGPGAVRCAWLTNGAVISGFTLRGGATRSLSGPVAELTGGGIWGVATTATATNCIITANYADSNGGGASQVTLINCTLSGNSAGAQSSASGGGAYNCNLTNCVVTHNGANFTGGGAAGSKLRNCAIVENYAVLGAGGVNSGTRVNCAVSGNRGNPTGGAAGATLVNCIVYGNQSASSATSNYSGCTFSYSCSLPLPSGTSNIGVDPHLLSDGMHLAADSPCRAAGITLAGASSDIDGQAWVSPPSIGCDEWLAAPAFANQPQPRLTSFPLSLSIGPALVVGQEPFAFWWYRDGSLIEDGIEYASAHTTNLVATNFDLTDIGNYQLVASNAFGMVTSAVASVVVHCVDAVGSGPVPPYSDWASAATNIQDAIDVAQDGHFVLVTNGTYITGSRTIPAGVSNRIALTKPLTVSSVRGATNTVIQGAWDPNTTNGPLAIRCAWVSDGATLRGFTLQNGATPTNYSGGGVYANSTNALIANCIIRSNAASYGGGGCYRAWVSNCFISGNQSGQAGGGTYESFLVGSLISSNSVINNGGGTYNSTILNCTIIGNSALTAGGTYGRTVANSIVYFNSAFSQNYPNYDPKGPSVFSYSCTTPAAPGNGNITAPPQLLNSIYLTSTSPCRGAGSTLYSLGTDIDGEPWASPPSMGCDELWEPNVTGPLSVGLWTPWPAITQTKSTALYGEVIGRATRMIWSFGDGAVLANASYSVFSHAWVDPGDYTVTFTAFNADYPTGVSTDISIHVIPLIAPEIVIGGLSGSNFSLSFPGQPGVS